MIEKITHLRYHLPSYDIAEEFSLVRSFLISSSSFSSFLGFESALAEFPPLAFPLPYPLPVPVPTRLPAPLPPSSLPVSAPLLLPTLRLINLMAPVEEIDPVADDNFLQSGRPSDSG